MTRLELLNASTACGDGVDLFVTYIVGRSQLTHVLTFDQSLATPCRGTRRSFGLLHQLLRRLHHLVRGQSVKLVKVLREVSRLADLAGDAEGLDAVRNAGA